MSAQDLEQRALALLPELPPMAMTVAGDDPDAGHWYRAEQMRDYATSAIAAALRQQPAPVDLEQFREAVKCWRRSAAACGPSDSVKEADRLLSIIDSAGKVETQYYPVLPATADRLAIKMLVASGYVTEGKANEALCIAHGFDKGELAPHQPAPVVDDAMVDRYLAAQAKAVHEIDDAWGNGGKAASYLHPVREACRAGLTAALARAQGVQS